MNFFKSVFSDDPDPPQSQSGSGSGSESESHNAPHNNDQQRYPDPNSPPTDLRAGADNSGAGGWNFGGLIQTLTSKSESIIDTYRRDLQEFGTGLKKEIEVAHGSLGTVTHVIDEFGNTVIKGTAQIISQGKDAILAVDLDSDSDNSNNTHKHRLGNVSKRYSRFEAQVRAIQGDPSTYTEGPEDLDEYNKWKSEFSLDGKSEEMESFFRENEGMESVYKRVVPNNVDHETFWYRYYYKVYRLKKAEDVRARLVRRMSREEEELSWDVEDDDDDDDGDGDEEEDEVNEGVINKEFGGENMEKRVDTHLQIGSSGTSNEGETKRSNAGEVQNSDVEGSNVEREDKLLQSKELGNKTDKSVEESQVEKSGVVHEVGDERKETIEEVGVGKASKSGEDNAVDKNDSAAEFDEKGIAERKADGKSTDNNNESSVIASQHSAHEEEEEDLGWDEIEDISCIDEKKAAHSGSSSKDDLRKRLSTAEAEEDLSWDIEDDDEPAKA